jgi:hypothetical protein
MNALSLMLTRRYHAGGGSLRCFGSHRIRHATATLLVNNGMPLEEVSRYLGHSSTMPTRRYAQQTPDALGRRAAEALARAGWRAAEWAWAGRGRKQPWRPVRPPLRFPGGQPPRHSPGHRSCMPHAGFSCRLPQPALHLPLAQTRKSLRPTTAAAHRRHDRQVWRERSKCVHGRGVPLPLRDHRHWRGASRRRVADCIEQGRTAERRVLAVVGGAAAVA